MLGVGVSLWNSAFRGRGVPFSPSTLPNLAAWFKYGAGITSAGGLVSQWADASGNARHLKQPTATNQPALSGSAILFDGVDNFMKCDAFTLNQPTTVYVLFKQLTWTFGDRIFDGDASSSGGVYQGPVSSPDLGVAASAAFVVGGVLPLNTYGVLAVVFNGTSSLAHVNSATPIVTGNNITSNMGGLTLGRRGAALNYGNIEVREVLIFSAAHDAPTRAQMVAYLTAIGALP